MEENEAHRTTYLEELSSSDYEIADHQPDILGWEIVDTSDNEIGEVIDLIFDIQEKKVRYIVADLVLATDHSGYVLLPIGLVGLDDDEDEVVIDAGYTPYISSLPEYESGKTISPVEELAIRYALMGEQALPHAEHVVYERHPGNFYDHGHFDDEKFIKR
ncbi:hypothetical protein PBAL39_16796 [Pedobacter sp. BAL39]|uniref:PRC-barrel domain-containing protein n=1 Tax=Pedobacter sp. BAL39 TaxID=391596 RepID=UPI000155924B|nr:PRC-barrel domain-containing protein [Pedobacter sp. BAL39]EDM35159.1 hypothetical protein PBAL39_16796 [Pedobacter sp. BAL39]